MSSAAGTEHPILCQTCKFQGMSSEQSTEATRALGRSLVDTFGRGWAGCDMNLLMTVYSPEAVFIETPFTQAIHGTDAIRGYWNEVPYNHSEITFSSGEIYAAGPWFSTEFKCVFRRRRTGEWVEARGAIFCETDGNRITEMRMYWHRWNGGKETSIA
jgi:ketosteroid isomerase-like protein